MNPLLFAFYGDDFTGSADAMEALTINGVRTALFLGHPTQERLQEKLGELDANIASLSNSPDQSTLALRIGRIDASVSQFKSKLVRSLSLFPSKYNSSIIVSEFSVKISSPESE